VSDRAAWLNDLLQFEDTLELCRRVGCPRVTVSPFAAQPGASLETMADALQQAGEKAAEYDLLVAVRNGPETACPTGQALAELLSRVEAPNVQAAWNPVGALRAGEDPATGLMALAGLVTLVRCSDGRVEGGEWVDTPLGEGRVGWEEQLAQLAAQDFRGPISLEIYLEPRPKQGLRTATTLIHMIRDVRAQTASDGS
jgi:sugar phosphate isomerase/epimerase